MSVGSRWRDPEAAAGVLDFTRGGRRWSRRVWCRRLEYLQRDPYFGSRVIIAIRIFTYCPSFLHKAPLFCTKHPLIPGKVRQRRDDNCWVGEHCSLDSCSRAIRCNGTHDTKTKGPIQSSSETWILVSFFQLEWPALEQLAVLSHHTDRVCRDLRQGLDWLFWLFIPPVLLLLLQIDASSTMAINWLSGGYADFWNVNHVSCFVPSFSFSPLNGVVGYKARASSILRLIYLSHWWIPNFKNNLSK